jgi:glutathione S-transferase
MLKLYYAPGACSLAIHIVLEWLGEPYEAIRVKLGSPEYLKVNPAGAVPTLDTGEGWTLTQAGAILRYLARRFPEADLEGGSSLREQAEVDRWSCFFTGDLHPAFFPLFFPSRYTTARDDASLEAVKQAGSELVHMRYHLLEAHLLEAHFQGRVYIVGDKRSILDAYAFPMVRWGAAKFPKGLSKYPNIRAHHDRIAADPDVQRVLAAEAAR